MRFKAAGNNANGVVITGGTVTATNIAVTAVGNFGYGLYTNGGTLEVTGSRIAGSDLAAFQQGGTMKIAATMVDGGVILDTIACAGAYNASFVALGSSCQNQ